jgi:hypothetical protein
MTVPIKSAVVLDASPGRLVNTFRRSEEMHPLRVQVRSVIRLKVPLIPVPACLFPVAYLTLI